MSSTKTNTNKTTNNCDDDPAASTPSSSLLLFEIGEIVIARHLKLAKHLNGRKGEVMGRPDKATGRITVRYYEREKNQMTTKLILPDKLNKLPNRDDPRMGYIRTTSVADGKITDLVRIENGSGKQCKVCNCDLGDKFHLSIPAQDGIEENEDSISTTYYYDYCEEHYVKTYFSDNNSSLLRYCAICHQFVSIMEGRVLPDGVFDSFYPNGMSSDGEKLGHNGYNDNDDDDDNDSSNKTYWVHHKCYRCCVCHKDLSEEQQIRPEGFIIKFDPDKQTARFCCASSPQTTTGCDKNIEKYQAAQERLQAIKEMTIKEMKIVLEERKVPFSKKDDKASLVRKIVVTENQGKKGEKQKNVVSTFDKEANEMQTCHVVSGRSQPGEGFLDRACKHGSQVLFEDTPQQAMKRAFVSSCFTKLGGNFDTVYLQSGKKTEVGPGIFVPPIEAAIMATVDFFTRGIDECHLLREDIKERFIPKLLWSAAVRGGCEEEGCEDYVRCALSAALIANGILDEFQSKYPNLPTELDFFRLFAPPSAPLKRLVKDVTSSPARMYQFMDSPNHHQSKYLRACDCMQYVATAAAIETLRYKPMRVKDPKFWCAYCNAGLIQPKKCSLCMEVFYCNEECQVPHWKKVHKKECTGRQRNKENKGATNRRQK